MIRVERSFQNKRVISIEDELIFIYGSENPNHGDGIPADRGVFFVQKSSTDSIAALWIKIDPDNPKSWTTWGEGQPRYYCIFGYNGNAVAPRWLEVFSGIPSNATPFIMPENSVMRSLSVSASDPATAQFDVYKDYGFPSQTLLDSLSLAAQKFNTKMNLYYPLVAGESLSGVLSSGSAKNIIFNVFLQVALIP